uniref:VWFA domain-containing protein n=1 Tax=Arcella intermedia TaxID=1963864 RepID=A0A6B2LDS4_9EUKA|eukprot:TRINITY_DN11636_c0_g1_i1.p1 TRINITY_DN11636_c0_g1~~TRINITY_DN11636_c0_g1_i1.p1  ORF type:complete len:275 (+),score=74.83 TRINITY_DN11636_c0_g1_i1:47-871(+)
MGNKGGKSHGKTVAKLQPKTLSPSEKFQKISDRFQTIEEVQEGLRECGLESSNLIVGVDYTKSNTWNGKVTFGGKCLHHIEPDKVNPYQEVIWIMGQTLSVFDDDNLIPAFGFGDVTTKDKGVFPFFQDGRPSQGFQELLNRYTEITPMVQLSGPTSFAPLIREAIKIVQQSQSYHILLIIADGQVDNVKETTNAIVEASKHPLSIVTIGVGDGPWDLMEEFDDKLPQRQFDNFQFVPFHSTMEKAENREITFSVAALQEIPDQYTAIKKLGLL